MSCDHCEQTREADFSYNGHLLCCECMSELCSWFLDGGMVDNPEQFAYLLTDEDESHAARLSRFGSSGFVKVGYRSKETPDA